MSSIRFWNRSSIVLVLLSAAAGSVSAASGTIGFSGRITEPACAVNRSAMTIAAPTRSTARSQEVNGNVQLAVRCNTQQSVQILFEEANDDNGRRTFNAGNDAEVVLRHANKTIKPGDSISYTFAGKKDAAIALSTVLLKGKNSGASPMQSNILVSFSYQ